MKAFGKRRIVWSCGILLVLLASHSTTGSDKPVLSVSFLGFYNSESEEFDPKPIGYARMVRYADVHAVVTEAFTDRFDVLSFGAYREDVVKADEESPEDLEGYVREASATGVSLLNEFLLRGSEANSSFPTHLRIPMLPNANPEDHYVLVVGLETQTRPGSLTSGLVAMVFGGDSTLSVAMRVYDFGNYNSEIMAADCVSMIQQALDGPESRAEPPSARAN